MEKNWIEIIQNPEIAEVRVDVFSPAPRDSNLWITLDGNGKRVCLGNEGILFAFEGYKKLSEYKEIIQAIKQESERRGWDFDENRDVTVKTVKTKKQVEQERERERQIAKREEYLAQHYEALGSGSLLFMAVGWPNGSHSHRVEEKDIKGSWVVLCDICPICGYITDTEEYRGENAPSFLGVVEDVEETHGSCCHGMMPVSGARAPEQVESLIRENYFGE